MKEQKTEILLGGLTILMGSFYLFLFSNTPLLQPDSSSYIKFSPIRPIGYPLFLWTIKTLTGSYKIVPFFQLSFYFAATFYGALNFYKLSKSLLLTVGLLLGISLNIGFIKLFSSLLTDVLGGGFLLLFLGTLFSFIHQAQLKKIYVIWSLLGAACLIRPVFYCLIGVMPLLYFMNWPFFRENLLRRSLFPLSVFLLILSLGSLGQYMNHGFFKSESFLGNNLVGKIGLIVDPSIPSKTPLLMHTFGEKSATIQKILNKAPTLHFRYLLSVPYYDTVRFSLLPTFLPSLENQEDVDSFSKSLAFEVIKARPGEYAKDVLMNYCALWQLWDFYSFEERKELETLLYTFSSEEPLKAMYGRSSIRAEANQKFGNPLIVKSVRGVLAVVFILSLLFPLSFLVLWIKRQSFSPMTLGGALTGVTLQSGYILTSLLQAGIARYALLFWPCVITLLAVSLKLLLDSLKFK